jgi:hypothetical protein
MHEEDEKRFLVTVIKVHHSSIDFYSNVEIAAIIYFNGILVLFVNAVRWHISMNGHILSSLSCQC